MDGPAVLRRQQLWAALTVFAALRVLVVLGLKPARFGDTESYFHLSFLGHAPRLWTAPLLFRLVADDGGRVAAQTIIGIACWWFAAVTVARDMRDDRTRVAAIGVICAMALSIEVASWDLTILSESLTISLTVLVIALWWRELLHPTSWTAVGLVAASVLWVFTRQPNVLVNGVIVVAAATSIVWARPRARRVAIVAPLLVTALWAGYALRNDQSVERTNINAVLITRIEPVPSYLSWWLAHGLPHIPQRFDEVVPSSPIYQAEYTHWLDEHGPVTYAAFLVSHPRFTLLSPLPDVLPVTYGQLEQRTEPSMLGMAEHYGAARQVLPAVVTLLIVDPGGAGLVLTLTFVAALGTWILRRRRQLDKRFVLPLMVLAVGIPHALVVWHGATSELGRLSVGLSVSTRLALWTLVLLLADRWLVDRRNGPAAQQPAETVVRG